jgi:hypothetical protein
LYLGGNLTQHDSDIIILSCSQRAGSRFLPDREVERKELPKEKLK